MTCPKCGSGNAGCHWQEVGGALEYQDEYDFYCPQCGHTATETKFGGRLSDDDRFTRCPYCAKSHHPRSPDQAREVSSAG